MTSMASIASISRRFPASRLRRSRMHPWSRDLVRENTLTPKDLIWPIFVMPGKGKTEPVVSMPGVERMTIDIATQRVQEAYNLGIPAVAIFPVTSSDRKSPNGDEALNSDNLMCQSARAIKETVPDIGIIGDVALDPYTTHGHDGIVNENGEIDNDRTVEILVKQAVLQASNGFDVVAPSDMQDGRIGAIRDALESEGGSLKNTMILSYAAKYASAFYGPFRDAVGSGSNLGKSDKRTYQQDPGNGMEAIHEAAMDVAEGADMLMVKPGLPYLDVVKRVKETTGMPVYAYQVSGEYAMIQAAAANGWLDASACFNEALLCFKRAGCDGILTYAAVDVAKSMA